MVNRLEEERSFDRLVQFKPFWSKCRVFVPRYYRERSADACLVLRIKHGDGFGTV